MNQEEFISKTIGLPWVNRQSSFKAVDCWGLVLLYYKHVLKIELPTIKGYEDGGCDTSHGWSDGVDKWVELKSKINNCVFTCYKSGKPVHVGIVISPTKVLHSRGFVDSPGKVEIHSVRAIESIYGKMTFHKFKG